MIEFLSDIDTQLLLFFNGIHSPFWDYFMSAFTGKVISHFPMKILEQYI